jgi:CheY-like chemotaxis protein
MGLDGCESILLAEDDPHVRDATRAILEFAGYRVITAINGKEAVACFERCGGAIDLVLMDVIMPVMNGMDAYRRLRRLRPDVRVIFSSGYTGEILQQEGIDSNNIRLLQKPVSPDALLAAVRESLDSPPVLLDASP